jgi:AcrR family transcriptional regulator
MVGSVLSRPAPRAGRQQSRSASTRQAFLDAARAVFGEQGYAEASVAEIVRRAGASVGSLYHHFGGKNELFVALYDQWDGDLGERAAAAVGRAREAGEADPRVQFAAGARAYLEGCWQGRLLARLFVEGDGPPGFEALRRSRTQAWVRQNAKLLRVGERPVSRAMAAILTTVLGGAGREVVACGSAAEATELIDAVVAMLVTMPAP